MKRSMIAASVGAAALVGAGAAAAATIAVSPGHMMGWTPVRASCGTSVGGSQGFAKGPANAPAGQGSYRFSINGTGPYETIRSQVLDRQPLRNVTALRYWTYVTQFGSRPRAPYIQLVVFRGDSANNSDTLKFEPALQEGNGLGSPTPVVDPVKTNTWQSWDALHGAWFFTNDNGQVFTTLAHYLSLYPNARIASTPAGSFRIGAGCGVDNWAGFTGYIDDVMVGVSGAATTVPSSTAALSPSTVFNFEPTAPAPAPPARKTTRPGKTAGKTAGKSHTTQLCHKGHTISVDDNAVSAHMRHGDTRGACGHDRDRDHDGDTNGSTH